HSVFSSHISPPPRSPLFPYTTLFRSARVGLPKSLKPLSRRKSSPGTWGYLNISASRRWNFTAGWKLLVSRSRRFASANSPRRSRSEEHTSELQSQSNLVCRLLLEKKK